MISNDLDRIRVERDDQAAIELARNEDHTGHVAQQCSARSVVTASHLTALIMAYNKSRTAAARAILGAPQSLTPPRIPLVKGLRNFGGTCAACHPQAAL